MSKKVLDIDYIKELASLKFDRNISIQDIANQIPVEYDDISEEVKFAKYQQVSKWGSSKHGLPKIVYRLSVISDWLGCSINDIIKDDDTDTRD